MILTNEMFVAGMSRNNGFNGLQIETLGENCKIRGWKNRLIGKEVSQEKYDIFIKLKDHHFKRRDALLERKRIKEEGKNECVEEGMVILTPELIDCGRSNKGGWTRQQVFLLGVTDMAKGWKSALIGKKIPIDVYNKFLSLKKFRTIKTEKKIDVSEMVPIEGELQWTEQYKHPNWQRTRLVVFSRDKFTCTICGNKNKQLHVHHRRYVGKFIWDAPLKSMITVCDDCHFALHHRTF